MLVPNSWDLVVTCCPLTYVCLLFSAYCQRAPKRSQIHMKGKPISIYMLSTGALFCTLSIHQTYETCVFIPQGVGTYTKWLPWWLLFIGILPCRVPSQHWWYLNPVSQFGFLVSWSQISDNTNLGLASPKVYFEFSGHDSTHFSRKTPKAETCNPKNSWQHITQLLGR